MGLTHIQCFSPLLEPASNVRGSSPLYHPQTTLTLVSPVTKNCEPGEAGEQVTPRIPQCSSHCMALRIQ